MSFFSKLLKGLGFEEDEQEQKPKQPKVKKEKPKPVINASFDLEKEDIEKSAQIEEKIIEPQEEARIVEEQKSTTSFSLDIIKVTNQVEVQEVVTKIKKGEKVIINMSALCGADLTRSLDFLTGAVFALDKAMQKVDNSIFIIQ